MLLNSYDVRSVLDDIMTKRKFHIPGTIASIDDRFSTYIPPFVWGTDPCVFGMTWYANGRVWGRR